MKSRMKSRTALCVAIGAMTFGLFAISALPAAAQSNAMAKPDQALLKDIAQANIAEIESGKVALGKSTNDDIKKFAQMMVDDHGKALTEVQSLASAKGVTLPTEPDMKHKAVAVEFKALKGSTFDSRYVKQAGVGDHEATEKLLKKTQANAKDADLKALATKMLPVVDGHLNHARELAKM